MPGARRIHMVYDPKQNAWLARVALEAAQSQDLELVVYPAADLRTAMQYYQKILTTINPKRDALWLPQDSTTVDDASVLPLALESAWSRSFVVFSSSLSHVSRGALFALYPDNFDMGRDLAGAALERIDAKPQENHTVTPLRAVRWTVNLRTASHLGLRLSTEQERRVNMAFPQP
jgi:putative ABC transport system substrate-binding protein